MNIKRLILSIAAGFVVIFATDYLIHAVWLLPDYDATKELWRPEAEMEKRFWQMLIAQFLCVATFVVIWAMGFADRASIKTACVYGLLMGMFQQVTTIITHVVQPFPTGLAMKWIVSGLAQAVLLGVVTFFVYKPEVPSPGNTLATGDGA